MGKVIAEIDLVVIGVLVSLVLLPDAKQYIQRTLRETQLELLRQPGVVGAMKDEAVDDLIEGLLAQKSSPDAAALATAHGWKPLIAASQPGQGSFRRDLDYSIDITREVDDPALYAIQTTFHSRRPAPVAAEPWVSFVRTPEALREEFVQDDCLSCELVLVSADLWQILVDSERLDAAVSWSADSDPLVKRGVVRPSCDVLRLTFEAPSWEPEAPVQLTEQLHFVGSRFATFFPVRFSKVFCLGRTRVRLRLDDPDVTDLDAFVSFAGDLNLNPVREGVHTTRGLDGGGPWSVQVATSDQAVLWPGSGIVFAWQLADQSQDRLERPEATV